MGTSHHESAPAGLGIGLGVGVIGLVSAAACVFLFWLIYFCPKAAGVPTWIETLPYCNAAFNGLAACCLAVGYRMVRQKRILEHRNWMLAAFGCSVIFLASYVTYHAFHAENRFSGLGPIRWAYFFILISHIGLSVVSLPLVLTTLWLGLSDRVSIHRKVAKWTFPIWTYVSLTGVLIVIFLKALQ